MYDQTPETIIENIHKSDYKNIKKSYMANIVNKVKRQVINWEVIFATHITDKVLLLTYKRFYEWEKVTDKKIQMAIEEMLTLTHIKSQIKTIVMDHFWRKNNLDLQQ